MKKTLIVILLLSISFNLLAQENKTTGVQDRQYWTTLCYKISAPVLEKMSKGELQKNMQIEVSPTWDNRRKSVTYMEAFGRLMTGIAPWLDLPNDNTQESKQREQLRAWALKSYANAVDPQSPDYLQWEDEGQALVDAAFIANSFIRAPNSLWPPLDKLTKERYIEKFKSLRSVKPAYNNWLLFRAMVEIFLVSIDEQHDGFALDVAIRKMDEWYLGDGWYSDGKEFSLDYYNSFVIHPMLVETLEIMKHKNMLSPLSFDDALARMQRYNYNLERVISPEGTFSPIGRSITYRLGVFQPLMLASWKYTLPKDVTYGQLRYATTTVMKNMFEGANNFNEQGYLNLGFVGHQPNLADSYTNNGSMYLTSLVFIALGCPNDHPFWTEKPADWTARKAWKGDFFPKSQH